MKAAGGVLTAKQAPRRPGTAPALGLRRDDVPPFYRRPTGKGRTNHVIPQLAAEPPLRPGTGPGPTPSRAAGLAASRDASANLEVLEDRFTAQLHRAGRATPSARTPGGGDGRLQQRRPSRPGHGELRRRQLGRQRAAGQRPTARSSRPETPPPASAPRSLAVGDFNGDGKLDLATVDWTMTSASRACCSATATAPSSASSNIDLRPDATRAVAVGDFNADGKLDRGRRSGRQF